MVGTMGDPLLLRAHAGDVGESLYERLSPSKPLIPFHRTNQN